MNKKFSIKDRIFSFTHAFSGLKIFFLTQQNAWIHGTALIGIITSGFWVRLNAAEWIEIILAASLVIVAEIINTAIEFLTDHVTPEYHEQAGKVKDIAAAGVLVASIAAVIIGCFVFIPKFLH